MTELKKCPLCKRDLPLSEFGNNKSTPTGKQPRCKECFRITLKKYLATPAGKKKAAASVHKYQKTDEGKASAKRCQVKRQKAITEQRYYNNALAVQKFFNEHDTGVSIHISGVINNVRD